MHDQVERARAFLDLHRPGAPLPMPDPWDAGSARLAASLGFANDVAAARASFEVAAPERR